MAINRDKPHLWKKDIARSVDLFNEWFIRFAPKAFRETRTKTVLEVDKAIEATGNLRNITPEALIGNPHILQVLRMATCPPLARDRLIGLGQVNRNLVCRMENDGLLPRKHDALLDDSLGRICDVLRKMLDVDIFPWLDTASSPSQTERVRASTIVSDRLCGAVSDPIIRNAQEKRQLALIKQYLEAKGYSFHSPAPDKPISLMEPGTFSFRTILVVGGEQHRVRIPIDVVIQPKSPIRNRLPILIEAKSAGDFTNTNKRRKEEAVKIRQLRETYGVKTRFILFLCGYFDSGYLGYEAAEGIDWIWEHRLEDFDKLGI